MSRFRFVEIRSFQRQVPRIYKIRRSLISVFISSFELQGLLMSVFRPADRPTKLPVQRKLDFESHIDVRRIDDDESDDEYMIPCGQISGLVKLEDAWSGMFLRDGWMRSKVKDIKWLSEVELTIPSSFSKKLLANSRSVENNMNNSQFLGLNFDIGGASQSNSMSERTFQEIATPATAKFNIQDLPNELIRGVIDKMPIRDALNMSQTCKHVYALVESAEFWKHRLLRDLNCYSICQNGDHGECGGREVLKHTYSLVSKASDLEDEEEAPYEEML